MNIDKLLFSLVFIFAVYFQGYSQNNADSLLQVAKEEFGKPHQEQDYSKVVALLSKAESMDPSNLEILYFLGYGYDRLNSKDATFVPQLNYGLSTLASTQFEKIINSGRPYTGEKLYLDPYSKITGIWGVTALKYLYHNQLDSAKIAFLEGKNRHGFHEALLEVSRNTLSSCAPNSILISSGDLFTLPLLYTQIIDSFRTDIQVIDIAMLNTDWYCEYIKHTAQVDLLIDSIPFNEFPPYMEATKKEWAIPSKNCPSNKTTNWKIDRLRHGKYLYKGDLILERLITLNNSKTNIYFTSGYIREDMLSLDNYLIKGVFVNELSFCEDRMKIDIHREMKAMTLDYINDQSIQKSDGLVNLLNYYRYGFYHAIKNEVDQLNFEKADELLSLMNTLIPEDILPYSNIHLKNYFNNRKK